jgi:hypothetical protein
MSNPFADTSVEYPALSGHAAPSSYNHRSHTMHDLPQYSLVQELQRERLRQAERRRAERAALRARRALVQQLMR